MPVNAVVELAVHMHQFQNLALTDKGCVVAMCLMAPHRRRLSERRVT